MNRQSKAGQSHRVLEAVTDFVAIGKAQLLNAVIHTFPTLEHVAVEVHYPNFGLRTSGKGVNFHHGYVDSIYELMSTLKKDLFPASRDARFPWQLEEENFAWIDFFWSTLGRSGDMGADVGLLYDMLQDPPALEAVANNLADAIVASGQPRLVPAFIRRSAARKAATFVASRVANLERSKTRQAGQAPAEPPPRRRQAGALIPAGALGLREYLEGPIYLQIDQENPGGFPEQVTFVFGHTHKPYEATTLYANFRAPVRVHNTGGWVVDTLEPDTKQGAAAVLLDEKLNVASLRLYSQQQLATGLWRVRVRAVDDPVDNPLPDRLQSKINLDEDPWSRLSDAVAKAVPERYACLRTIIDKSIEQANARPPRPSRSP